VLSHSQLNTWFKIFVQVQASKTGGAVFFVPTGANCSEDSRNNMNQLHRPTICAQYYVGSCTNKGFTVPCDLSLPSIRGFCVAVEETLSPYLTF